MDIRLKITYQFVTIVAVILLSFLVVVYVLFVSLRQAEYRDRLTIEARAIGLLCLAEPWTGTDLLHQLTNKDTGYAVADQVMVLNDAGDTLYHSGGTGMLNLEDPLHEFPVDKDFIAMKKASYQWVGKRVRDHGEDVLVYCAGFDEKGLLKNRWVGIALLMVFLVCMVIIYQLGRRFASRALSPISRVIDQVNQIDISNINARVDPGSSSDEIADLADTFNGLLQRLESAIQLQKDFISNSSHELRTPLTVITGQLDVILMKDRTREEYKATLSSVLEDIKRLNRLTNRLLILSRADTEFSVERFHEERVDEILWKSRAEVQKRHEDFLVSISFDQSISGEHHFNVMGNIQLLNTAFINLIENGCKYSPEKETEITLSVSGSELEVVFRDRGIGIPPDELVHIFEPFYRGSNVEDTTGHGIGLSLVDRIIKLHGGTTGVESVPGEGTVFTITLPLA